MSDGVKQARKLYAAFVVALLALGYIASQIAASRGQQAEYAAKVDVAPVNMVALIGLVAAIVLYLIPAGIEPTENAE